MGGRNETPLLVFVGGLALLAAGVYAMARQAAPTNASTENATTPTYGQPTEPKLAPVAATQGNPQPATSPSATSWRYLRSDLCGFELSTPTIAAFTRSGAHGYTWTATTAARTTYVATCRIIGADEDADEIGRRTRKIREDVRALGSVLADQNLGGGFNGWQVLVRDNTGAMSQVVLLYEPPARSLVFWATWAPSAATDAEVRSFFQSIEWSRNTPAPAPTAQITALGAPPPTYQWQPEAPLPAYTYAPTGNGYPKTVWVEPHVRSNGSHVRGHFRSPPHKH